jgi:hypothetical protein
MAMMDARRIGLFGRRKAILCPSWKPLALKPFSHSSISSRNLPPDHHVFCHQMKGSVLSDSDLIV